MDDDLVVRGITIPGRELVERFSRSSGPGGQGVNTTDSRVQLTFDLARSSSIPEHLRERALRRLAGHLVDGTVSVTASERRSQLLNRETARERLAALLSGAFAPGPRSRRPTRPTKAAVERRLKVKKGRAVTKRLRRSTPRDAD